jgi:acyl-CoA thioesterase YciA
MTDKNFHPSELEAELAEYREEPMIRVVMMPKDTNALGSIFGGVILSHLDIAAGEEAYKMAGRPCVTKVMKEVDFAAPVEVGDWVSFYTRTERVGNTSVTVRVLVVAHRGFNRADVFRVTEAEVVFVAIDDNGNPTQIDSERAV